MNPALTISAEPGDQLVRRERLQGLEVDEHGRRLVERADQVLAGGGVDAGLPAHGRVDHGQQRGGDVHDPDSAHPCRGDEPGQIRHRSPAEPDDHVGAGEPGLPAHLPAEARDGQRLALLRVGHLDAVRIDAGGLELFPRGLGGVGESGLVDDERPPGAEPRHGGGETVAHRAADQDRIGLVGTDLDEGDPPVGTGRPSVVAL